MKSTVTQGQKSHGPLYASSQNNTWLKSLILLVLLALSFQVNAQNCNSMIHDLNQFSYELTTNAENEILISCYMGTPNQPVQGLLGMDVTFYLGGFQSDASTATMDYNGSWLQREAGFEDEITFSPEEGTLRIAWQQNDCVAQEGYGLIGTIKLKEFDQHQDLSQLVQMLDGIVIIENLPITKNNGPAPVEPMTQVGPNPTSDYLHIWGAAAGADYQLVDMAGRTVLTGKVAHPEKETLTLTRLTPGAYSLILKNGVAPVHKRIIVQK